MYLFRSLVDERSDKLREVGESSLLDLRSDDFEDRVEDRIFLLDLNDLVFVGIVLVEDRFNEFLRQIGQNLNSPKRHLLIELFLLLLHE